jgi:IS1 family transposase
VLAYVFGRRKDEVFLQLKELLEPFGQYLRQNGDEAGRLITV